MTAATIITRPGLCRPGSHTHRLLRAYSDATSRRANDGGLTDPEAASLAALPAHACFWKRSSELRARGLIALAGWSRPDQFSGEPRIVCVLTASGRMELDRLDAAASGGDIG